MLSHSCNALLHPSFLCVLQTGMQQQASKQALRNHMLLLTHLSIGSITVALSQKMVHSCTFLLHADANMRIWVLFQSVYTGMLAEFCLSKLKETFALLYNVFCSVCTVHSTVC